MMDFPVAQESLNELRLELERATFAETEAREELGAFFEALGVLTDFKNEEVLLPRLLEIFRRSLNFDHAFILSTQDSADELETIFSTAPQFERAKFRLSRTLARALGGPVACFDISQVDEWESQPDDVKAGVVSALYLNVKDAGHRTILVCTHSVRGAFGSKDFYRAGKFAIFLSQALSHLNHTRRLRQINESLQNEIA